MAKKYKMKTNKSAAKRFSFTSKGKIKRKKAGMRHFMRRKNVQTKRNLRNRGYIADVDAGHIRALMPNG
ncbi:MAG: 50S ribosomal protein L35 [Deltaproteobacteria bacterium]|nr:50S ribosomal protein L35 [Deltaproteobacteria bacterium]